MVWLFLERDDRVYVCVYLFGRAWDGKEKPGYYLHIRSKGRMTTTKKKENQNQNQFFCNWERKEWKTTICFSEYRPNVFFFPFRSRDWRDCRDFNIQDFSKNIKTRDVLLLALLFCFLYLFLFLLSPPSPRLAHLSWMLCKKRMRGEDKVFFCLFFHTLATKGARVYNWDSGRRSLTICYHTEYEQNSKAIIFNTSRTAKKIVSWFVADIEPAIEPLQYKSWGNDYVRGKWGHVNLGGNKEIKKVKSAIPATYFLVTI